MLVCWEGGQEGDTAFFRVTADGGMLLTPELEPSPDPHEVTYGLPYGSEGQCSVPWAQGPVPFDPDPTTVTVTQIGTTGPQTDSVFVEEFFTTGPRLELPPDTVVTLSMSMTNPAAGVLYYNDSAGPPPSLVPALPPDEFPAFLYDDSVMVTDSLGGRWSRNVLAVHFHLGTSQAERHSGIGAIDGAVIGGAVLDEDGYYLVQVPGGSLAAVDSAIATLRGLSSVMSAMRIAEPLPPLTAHLRPDDGAGWAVTDWSPRVSNAAGTNWNLEAAAFPLAWGCTTGDPLIPVGMIDRTIAVQNVADLTANLDAANSVALNSHLGQPAHGAWVMSVIGAEGDNGQGIAGGMWRASVSGYEVATDHAGMPLIDSTGAPRQTQFSLAWRLLDARRNGMRVVNISLAQPDTAAITARDTSRMMVRVQPLIDALNYPDMPLVVIAAGNVENPIHPNDAFWSGYPIAADSVSGQVVVVTSHDVAGQLASDSRRGALVHVAAGGVNVTVLDSTGQRIQVSGTSFAAPLVSALAGLLFSFDTTLTPQQARDLIVQGAGRDGRAAGGIPIVHAYETLKLAARRMGAPLCGNRVWASGPTIVAERETGDDTLTTASANVFLPPQTFHGGRRVDYKPYGGDPRTLYWSATGWKDTTQAVDDTTHTPTGASWSPFGLAHDLDSLAKIQQVDFNPPPVAARLYSQGTDGLGNPLGPQRTVTTFSGWWIPNYMGSDPINEVGYSPLYGRAYVALRSGAGSYQDEPVTIHETDLVTGQSSQVITFPVAWGLISVAVAEDETELAVNHSPGAGGDCYITYVPLVPYARPQRTINVGAWPPECGLRGTASAPVAQGEGR